MNTTSKKWMILFLIILLVPMVLIGSIVYVIDPYFHYRKPRDDVFYELKYDRYINPGILKHFDYNGLIIGTSMCMNFKTSEFDSLFDVNSVKTTQIGASYAEIRFLEEIALDEKPDLKIVIRGLDYNKLDWGEHELETDYLPMYLYEDNMWTDVAYLFNRETLINMRSSIIQMIRHPGQGGMTSFDVYGNWMAGTKFGLQQIRENYATTSTGDTPESFVTADGSKSCLLTQEEGERVIANIRTNVVGPAQKRPDVEFYCFFTPYSIFYWDELVKKGGLHRQIEIERIAINELLKCDNIKLFSFNREGGIVENPNNYKDYGHYGEWINSEILRRMSADKNRLNWDNCEEYLNEEESYYCDYDYDWLWDGFLD